jgi:hypothetical protein
MAAAPPERRVAPSDPGGTLPPMRAPPFDAAAWHAAHPEYDWARGLVGNIPSGPWAVFSVGDSASARPTG